MLVLLAILAAGAAGAVAWRPGSAHAAGLAAACAAVALAAGAVPAGAAVASLAATLPMAVFLAVAIWLAVAVEASGLCERAAVALAALARGRAVVLYGLLCLLCAVLTTAISLDGAVVVLAPVVVALGRVAPHLSRALFLGTVAAANAFSVAVPQGNPTNLVVMERLGISAPDFITRMAAPALVATVVLGLLVALRERRALAAPLPRPGVRAPLGHGSRRAAAALGATALAGWAAPVAGSPPWWAVSAAAALGLLLIRTSRPLPRPPVPWRLFAQVGALVLLAIGLLGRLGPPALVAGAPATLVALALMAGAAAALANNLPASAALAGAGVAAPAAYAALIGLGVGALATPHGSVATLIAEARMCPPSGTLSPATLRFWIPAAAVAVAAAAITLWLTGPPA